MKNGSGSGSGYVFGSEDEALGAGLDDARKQLQGDEAIFISGGPKPDPATIFASRLADLRERVEKELLEPFADAVHAGDTARVEAYRVLLKPVREEIARLEAAADDAKKT